MSDDPTETTDDATAADDVPTVTDDAEASDAPKVVDEPPAAGATEDGKAEVTVTDDADPKSTDVVKESKTDRKAEADAAVAELQVVARRTVTSRRVTPKGGAAAAKSSKPTKDAAPATTSKARDAKKTESVVSRAPVATPQEVYAKGPSPWWVPAIMFGLLIVGALIIMTNYMGVFGDASNVRLVIGLAFILGGIIAATQYR